MAAAAGLALALLALLVALGELDVVDSYAVHELMPGRLPTDSRIPVIGHLLQYHGHHFDASQVVRIPGTIVASLGFFLIACIVLWRRRDLRVLSVFVAGFAVGNAMVVLGQEAITRPALYAVDHDPQTRIAGFASSFPSGHATRLVLLAAIFAYLWPRFAWLFALWVVGALFSLEIDRIHTPSDILGGVLLAATIIAVMPLVLPLVDRVLPRLRSRAVDPLSGLTRD